MTREDVKELLREHTKLDERSIAIQVSRFFLKNDNLTWQDVCDRYSNSFSKNKEIMIALAVSNGAIRKEITREDLLERKKLEAMLNGESYDLPEHLKGLPLEETLFQLMLLEGKKEQQARYLVSRSIGADGLIKPSSKYAKYF